MLQHLRGIVLKTIKTGETTLLVHIYTDLFGMRTYSVAGARSAKHNKAALLQPLYLLNLVVYHRENRDINHLKEMQLAINYTELPFSMHKMAIAMFITEVLHKTLKGEHPNLELFDWLSQYLTWLDTTTTPVGHVPVSFLLQLSRFLGILPLNNYPHNFDSSNDLDNANNQPQIAWLFHLNEGFFVKQPANSHGSKLLDSALLPHTESHYLAAWMQAIDNPTQINIPNTPAQIRKNLLYALLRYYRLHIENFGELRSVAVLASLFNDV
ncbi:MAG: DNA repair protein RecO [Sphingobacteriales bacterium]|jgi:DNA repair protein RecO (recombination protein O)|nr:DNA repair protein RecO [Sphingobacteriales bacterium]MBP9142265.1 DNA repair protein RecO [Chitinophagales bacterium]MDA0199942.1 DNA repair protein RecO [Bacteroidota bacterium]MBK6889632.1 DNA repair protein RecO [Sphingobacteriales bacterium]MBK7527855.1 DNA repair protein RecO [Sphingobacteriales bacterium]